MKTIDAALQITTRLIYALARTKGIEVRTIPVSGDRETELLDVIEENNRLLALLQEAQ